MLSFIFDPFPVLETERLVLRKPDVQDIDELFLHRSNKEHMRFIPHRYITERQQAEAIIPFVQEKINASEGINWAITAKGNDTILGMIGYVRFIKDHHRAEIGYGLHPPHQGKGIIHEAAMRVIKFGFEELGLETIEAIINSDNMASKKVVERLGFSNDAFFRKYLLLGDKFVDANVYSILRSEFLTA